METKKTKRKSENESSSMLEDRYCKDCGWPVVHTCVNNEMCDFVYKKGEIWDWWLYCSNKGCVNHEGEGVFQNSTSFEISV